MQATTLPVNIDGRGVSRPLDGNSNGIALCDIREYEAAVGSANATPTNIPTPTNTPTPSPTATDTPTNTPTNTPTAIDTLTNTPVPLTHTPTATNTSTQLPTATHSATPTQTPTNTLTPTATRTLPESEASVILYVDQSAILQYTPAQGGHFEMQAAVGTVNEQTTVLYNTVVSPTDLPVNLRFGKRAFQLTAYQNDLLVENISFQIAFDHHHRLFGG